MKRFIWLVLFGHLWVYGTKVSAQSTITSERDLTTGQDFHASLGGTAAIYGSFEGVADFAYFGAYGSYTVCTITFASDTEVDCQVSKTTSTGDGECVVHTPTGWTNWLRGIRIE